MPKRLATILIIFLFYTLILPFSLVAQGNIQIYINGQDLTEELDPLSKNGQLLVNARPLAENLQAELKWYQAIKTLTLSKEKVTIKMMVNNPYIQVNNKTFKTDGGLIIKDGHSYIPLREIAGAFGYLFQKKEDSIYIFKPESIVKGISWQKEGQQLLLEMDKLAPYRIRKTGDPKRLIVEIDKASLAEDFSDGLSNKNFYLKINKAEKMARLQLVIISKYPIPFQLDKGVEEDGNNLIINFLPQIMAINWQNEQLEIRANGEMKKPEVSLLDNPRRLVIDIPEMMLNKFDLNLPANEYIKDIRVSQFKYDPVILRVVVELKEGRYLYPARGERADRLILKPSRITRVKDLSCNGNIISFKTDRAINPDFFTLKDPARLVINLLNTVRDDNMPDKLEVEGDLVKRIRTARFNEETVRIVADLTKLTGYRWREEELPGGGYKYIIDLKNTIDGISLADSGQKTDINISFSGQAEYEVKKFSYPDRLVVDVKGLANNIDEENLPEPVGLIKEIRVNQFSNEPKIVRFVFELKNYYGHVLYSSNPDNSVNIGLAKAKDRKIEDVIVIDPGHGGFDPGAVGPSGLYEKDVNLDIALRVDDLLQRAGYNVLLTRDDDRFISLKERVTRANEAEARLFVSIHINASSEAYSEGTETFLAPEKAANSTLLATLLQEELVKSLKRVDRGVKKENLYVIKYTTMPAALVEVAFISNPHEETLLRNDLFKDKVAGAIVRGITRYLEKIERGDEGAND
ncbi:MAG: N-acetylmuramoyl-L-alanine amidase [Halanaerobiales bacterium]|nr:N-acetylmuramoyl-L-alanine amidase [Halanaerobiales bacterium]